MILRPRSLQILITNKCKLNCRFCHFSCKSEGKELEIEIIDSVLRQGKEMGINNVVYNGGEPLDYSNLRELLELTRKHNCIPYFVTNGWDFGKHKDLFLEYGVKQVIFGLDGMSDRNHDFLRGKEGSFERVVEAIRLSKRLGFSTSIQFIVTKQSFHEFEDFLKFSIENKICSLLIHKLTHDGKAYKNKEMDLSEKQEDQINNILSKYRQLLKIRVSSQYFCKERTNSICNHLSLETFNIDWNGKVNLCSLCPQFDFDFPSIKKESLKDCFEKIKKINSHFIKLREEEFFEWRPEKKYTNCDFCIEKFTENPEKYIFNVKCGNKIDNMDKDRCSGCLYKLRKQCFVN